MLVLLLAYPTITDNTRQYRSIDVMILMLVLSLCVFATSSATTIGWGRRIGAYITGRHFVKVATVGTSQARGIFHNISSTKTSSSADQHSSASSTVVVYLCHNGDVHKFPDDWSHNTKLYWDDTCA